MRWGAWTLLDLGLRSLSATHKQAAEQQAGGLENNNAHSDVDGSQQRGGSSEREAKIDVMNQEEHGPADGCRRNHDSPPPA